MESEQEEKNLASEGRYIFRAGSSLPEDKIVRLRSQMCIVKHNGEIYGISPEALLESFGDLPVKAVASEYGTIDINAEIQVVTAITRDVVPELIKTVGSCNIVRYDGSFYVLPQSLGKVRWGEEDVASLPGVVTTRKLSEAFVLAKKKSGIVDTIKGIATTWGIGRKPEVSPPSQIAPIQTLPRLVGSMEGYNIVEYNGWFYGLPQSLGKTDLQTMDPTGLPGVVRERTREHAEQRVRETVGGFTEPKRGRPAPAMISKSQPQLVGSLEGYNVIEYEGWFYGLPQALGEIDLSRTDVIEMPGVFRDVTRMVVENEIRELVGDKKMTSPD